jgi:HAD superfamily PSPase-like hydrolase
MEKAEPYKKRGKTKLIAFDWDGTLAKTQVKYSWALLNLELGCEDEQKRISDMYFSRKISYIEWCQKGVDLYIDRCLTEKKFYDIVKKNISLHTGALETINTLKNKGIKTGIISGGIYNVYEYFSRMYGLPMDYVSFSTKLIFDRDGRLVRGEYENYDYETDGKPKIFMKYCKNAGVSLDEAIYVGDSTNDINVFKKATGIAFSSDSEELKKHAAHIIHGNDMRELLKYIN